MTSFLTSKKSGGNRRSYFRIDDSVLLTYRQVPEEELLESLSNLEETVGDAFILAASFANISRATRPLNRQARRELPAVANYLNVLERKIDILARIILTQQMGVEEEQTSEVNLSAGGLEFQAGEPLPVDSTLEIRLVVFPSRIGILAGGRVLRCESGNNEHDPVSYTIALEFTHLRESDRQLIIKHMLNKQSMQLRQRRSHEED